MRTDVVRVSGRGAKTDAALRQADKVAAYKELSGKDALHLRLLTEEMMGMMRAITGESEGEFWIEDEDGVYQLHLQVTTSMDSGKRSQLLAASSSGRNESARGLMGRLRDMIDRSADEDVGRMSMMMFPGAVDHSSLPTLDWEWTMSTYQDQLTRLVEQKNEAAREIWDELEKSVVTHVADDVKVSIRGRHAEMIIYKKLG